MLADNCKKSDDNQIDGTPSVTVKDIDGNFYHTVTIDTQVWMAKNMQTTKYRDGIPIPNVFCDTHGETYPPARTAIMVGESLKRKP